MARPAKQTNASGTLDSRVKKTNLNHVFYFDIANDGRYREVAIVKMDKNEDGSIRSIYYIDISLLDNIDKGRLKTIITSTHANKYELWDLMSQERLSNGKNALDYFHQMTRVVHGEGALTTLGTGLAGIAPEKSSMVGSEFTDTASASLDTQNV